MMTPGMPSQELWMLATGELENQSNQIFYALKGYMIYISEYKQTLVSFHLRSFKKEKRNFSIVLFRPNLAVNLER